MQRTWWPEAGIIIVTGPYWQSTSIGLIGLTPNRRQAIIWPNNDLIYCVTRQQPIGCWAPLSQQRLNGVRMWTSDHIHCFCGGWITYPYPNCNDVLTKPTLRPTVLNGRNSLSMFSKKRHDHDKLLTNFTYRQHKYYHHQSYVFSKTFLGIRRWPTELSCQNFADPGVEILKC